jgi:anti-sigma factor (TIGR02949 family)
MEHVDCRHLLGSLSEYVEGSLQSELCAEIERHLAECENCQVVVDTLNKTIYLVHEHAAHVSVPGEVRQRLFRRLDLEDFLEK